MTCLQSRDSPAARGGRLMIGAICSYIGRNNPVDGFRLGRLVKWWSSPTSSAMAILIGGLISVIIPAGLQGQTVTLLPTSLSYNSQVVSTTSPAKVLTLKNGQSIVLHIS